MMMIPAFQVKEKTVNGTLKRKFFGGLRIMCKKK